MFPKIASVHEYQSKGMSKSKGGSGKGQGRKSHWDKKPESRISVPYELADDKQKKALAEIWSILNQAGLDLTGLLAILKSSTVNLALPSKTYSNQQPESYRMYSTPVAASFGVISSTDADAGGYEEVDLNTLLVRAPERTIILRVIGDSMIDDGIQPNSTLIVETCGTNQQLWLQPKTGDIVVALIDETDFTVKRFERTDKGAFLVPRNRNRGYQALAILNSDDEELEEHKVRIIGIVRKVIQDV
jgi:SOS-response transcriptional repressor LexA